MRKWTMIEWFIAFVFGVTILGCSGIAVVTPIANWYGAVAQSEVYRREGIEVTPMEIILGAKPAERTINIRP